jgi:hypothetical protein
VMPGRAAFLTDTSVSFAICALPAIDLKSALS